jgi:endonuclease YncB( thermonuclease family)
MLAALVTVRRVRAMLACGLLMPGFLPSVTAAESRNACSLTTIGSATVRSAADGTITLEDGRIVRLAGIELGESAATLPAGTIVTLKRLAANTETDRYGRLVAHVFINEDGAERWLQQDLVGRGLARVSARVGDTGCARILWAREQSARTAKIGLWGEPYYVIGKAEEPLEVLRQRGRFALVEGRVLSVRESGATIYVNFGRRWSEDFTVTIAKRNEKMFAAAGLAPKTLDGRRVRVRGWIEERGGPWVEAARPEQIEVVEVIERN